MIPRTTLTCINISFVPKNDSVDVCDVSPCVVVVEIKNVIDVVVGTIVVFGLDVVVVEIVDIGEDAIIVVTAIVVVVVVVVVVEDAGVVVVGATVLVVDGA